MHATLPLLVQTDFPALRRRRLDTLQVNVGYRCNQSCLHCHVNAGPNRTEEMSGDTVDLVLEVLRARQVQTLDITGGAPELNPHFRRLASAARALGVQVIDRCNLTILFEPGQEDLAEFLAGERIEIVASLPCYSLERVDRQRGAGVFDKSIAALQKLNALGYGQPDSGLTLNLVYNPQGPALPPDQHALQADYQRELGVHFGIRFNHLFALANMPIQRFGSTLVSKGEFHSYMRLAQAVVPRREPRHRDVHQPGQRRLDRRAVRLRLQPDARPADATARPAARAPARLVAAQRRWRRDPRRRPLLWLHRRPRQQLRRRAAGGLSAHLRSQR